jgi:hypothetical protein
MPGLTERKYGTLPTKVAHVPMDVKELMFWLYCPIKVPGLANAILPETLRVFQPMVDVVAETEDRWAGSYAYLTAKRLWCEPGCMGQRPGWHSDGFLTDDVNYVWYDAVPTVFFYDGNLYAFTADHAVSLYEMEHVCSSNPIAHMALLSQNVFRLDERVLHRPATEFQPCFRTFAKISISSERYAHEGNAINHHLGDLWPKHPRGAGRNCPQSGGQGS